MTEAQTDMSTAAPIPICLPQMGESLVEGTVVGRVFGRCAAVTSTKSYTGHTLGAAGALEVLYSVISITRGFVPPCLGVENVDPRLQLDLVTGQAREQRVRRVLTSSFGFGGNNCCIVIGGTP